MNPSILSFKVIAFVLFAMMMPQFGAPAEESSVTWVPLDDFNHFTIDVKTIAFRNGVNMTKGPWTALADPNAPFSAGTENWKLAQKIFANLFDFDFDEDVSGRYTVDCSMLDKLPSVYYIMGGVTFRYPPSAYLEKVMEHEDSSKCITVFAKARNSYPETAASDLVFGAPQLKYFGAILDKKNKRIGFVQPLN